jgi:hypothetical protein
MTNQELRDYFREEIKEVKDELKEMRVEHKVMHKDFYLFKGKALGFLAVFSIVINYAIDLWHKK